MLKDMSLTEEEAKEYAGDMCCGVDKEDGPKFPYGLQLYLDDATLEKLGITSLPNVGVQVNLMATAMVTSIEQRQDRKGESETKMQLQITNMEVQMPSPERNAASKMWPDMKD